MIKQELTMLDGLQKFFKYSVIFGLMPYVEDNKNNHRKLQQQKIYSLALLLVTALFGISGIIIRPLIDIVVSNLVSVFVFLAQILAMSIIIIEAMSTLKQQERFYTKAKKIELLFWRQLQQRFCARSQNRYLLRKYGLISLFTSGCLIGALLLTTVKFYDGYFCYAFPSVLIIRVRCIQLSIFADVIRFYQEGLNWKLTAIWSCKVRQQRQFLDVNYPMLESLEQLMLLKGLYRDIAELSQIWHACFGWSAFAIVVVFFLDITVNSYWSFLTLSNIYAFYFIFLTMLTLVALLCLLLMLCFTCQMCDRACRRTASLVHKLLQPQDCDTNARLYNDLVNEFSLQIVDNPIEFSAVGFFKISLRLLTAICSSLVTHMVILLQFRITDIQLQQSF